MPTALVSVSDKSGLDTFCHGLRELGWRIASTGGTARFLKDAGIEVLEVSELTGHPEMFSGRVKTLHPVVHAGILARRSEPGDVADLEAHGIDPIDLVAVNLYPFQETVAQGGVEVAAALEQIDIGGPTLLRAAAKNHQDVWPVSDPADYPRLLEVLQINGSASSLRRELAAKVFRHTATYDTAISDYLSGAATFGDIPGAEGASFPSALVRVQGLRYGENPDQAAAFYRDANRPAWGIPALDQVHGRSLSFNNLLDVDGALTAIAPFVGSVKAACAILKHSTPSGLAVGDSSADVYEKALACDPVSAFGSVIAFNRAVDLATATALAENFVECLIAPTYDAEALRILTAKQNIRILQPKNSEDLTRRGHLRDGLEIRGVRGGALMQTAARPVEDIRIGSVKIPTARQPTEREWDDLAFAWAAVQSVKSNAILLVRDGASIGIGAGQMSRVDSVDLAVRKARSQELRVEGSVMASDAFFPFRDGVDSAASHGVAAIIQPGGSRRDDEVIEAADAHGIAMVFTGRRLFRH